MRVDNCAYTSLQLIDIATVAIEPERLVHISLRRCLRLTCPGPLGRIEKASFRTGDPCDSPVFKLSANDISSGNLEFPECAFYFAQNAISYPGQRGCLDQFRPATRVLR